MYKIILIMSSLMLCFAFYRLGYDQAEKVAEKRIIEINRHYYGNSDDAVSYWKLKAKKEGLK